MIDSVIFQDNSRAKLPLFVENIHAITFLINRKLSDRILNIEYK